MPDVWATVTELEPSVQEQLAGVLETRGAEPRQREMRDEFLGGVDLPAGADVLEVGCGTGVLTRVLARLPHAGSVLGTDVAPALVDRARVLSADVPNVSFDVADCTALPYGDAGFDAVVFDSVLSHLPRPEDALAEARRVLRPGGVVAVFDGDYATTTVALGDNDPLQACVDAMMAASVTDRWVMRRLPRLVLAHGFEVGSFRSHGFLAPAEGGYMLTVVDRGADVLAASGQIDGQAAAALKAEARRRVDSGAFYGHIAYTSMIARLPAS